MTEFQSVVLLGLIGLIISLVLGYVLLVRFLVFLLHVVESEATHPTIRKLLKPIVFYFIRESRPKRYDERIKELAKNLIKASSEVDNVVAEMTVVSQERGKIVSRLEQQLSELSQQEQELRKKVKDLENVSLPVAEHFARLVEKGERGSAKRDYVLFALGVLFSTLVGIALQLIR